LGKTIIEHTIEVFQNSVHVHQLVVCLPKGDSVFQKLPHANSPKLMTVQGGDSRAQSVFNGLLALDATDDDWVLVHDAARPCFNNELLNSLITELADDEVGGIMAVRAKDTLKLAGSDNRISKTVDRSAIWQAQTPQMFRFKLIKESLGLALQQNVEITDEASALEWAGYQPKLVEGDACNLKVTTPEDLALVEFLLSRKASTISP
jgi:2-C-methyl-D-erythritol 4-phosphate cytidylyltransferase